MSVSIVLLPVALAMRVAMGEKKFNDWAESVQIKIPTTFESEEELVKTVKMTGYDCQPFYGVRKTHTKNAVNWFTWENVEGKWMAIFSKYNSREQITDILRDLQTKAGRTLFETTQGKLAPVPSKTFPTDFSDIDLLEAALRQHGGRVSRQEDGGLLAQFGSETYLQFHSTGEGPFIMEVPPATEEKLAYGIITRLDDTYRDQIQKLTYQTLHQRIEESSFSIESEEVLADKTIVITLNVNS